MKFLLILLHIYFVSFLDKPEKTAPQLSPRAIEQRQKWNIPTDQMDYPVSPMYMDSLRRMGAKIMHKSRWMNGVTCELKDELVQKVRALSFVTNVEMTRDNSAPIYSPRKRSPAWTAATATTEDRYISDAQLALYNLQPLHYAGYEGQYILMTVCDGGFTNANSMSCFRREQELGHFDFTDNADDFYGWSGVHGTECLSTISGITTYYRGAATRANYYLMRSEEDATESPKEMDNLVAALEKADSLGVNVFSVSLGYAYFDNDSWSLNAQTDLDGQTTRCSRAATIAARKGMLVVVAAGNDGTSAWRTISAPADADSILTVGAVDTDSLVADFSSYGPSSDGRIKPEVCAVGRQTALIYPDGQIVYSNGTSFAAPLIAGLAASLWSALPDENAMQIRQRIIHSAHRFAHPDRANHIGYGIPDAWAAYTMSTEAVSEVRPASAVSSQKIMQNGQLYILRDGKLYDVLGHRIE
jgi:hypothetical protein